MEKVLIIDLFNLLHRAYHAIPKTFRDSNGEPTNAIYGVTSMLINILDKVKPDYALAAVDGPRPTFRLEEFTGYKAHRRPMEDELSTQIEKVFEVLDAFGVKRVQSDGYEADDLAATITEKSRADKEVFILSNDKDLWQLANGNVICIVPSTRDDKLEWMGRKEVEARLGFDPTFIADYKGLRGDPSDNIPGVFGIGDKGAVKLINEYGSLENIYRNLDKISPESLRKKLTECYEQALMSKRLAQLILDVPVDLKMEEARFTLPQDKVKEVLQRYNFKSLQRRMGFTVAESVVQEEKQPSLGF